MHPAFSVIFFTVSSGAGYGLLAALGLLQVLDLLPADLWFRLGALGLALAAITAGLLSSTFHLGHPERAWRAFSQWRSSWLSREGVAAVVTYGPAVLLAAAWLWPDRFGAWGDAAGWAAMAMAVVTVYCTAMIYRSLTTIHQWANGWTVPGYLVFGLATGLIWLHAVMALFGAARPVVAGAAMAALGAAALVKLAYWRFIDTTHHPSTPESATGLGDIGKVELFEGPHTATNYLLQEMGFRVGRKHARKLRQIALAGGFFGAIAAAALSTQASGAAAGGSAFVAAVLASGGAVIERWLFFAEAKHVVTLYYGAERV